MICHKPHSSIIVLWYSLPFPILFLLLLFSRSSTSSPSSVGKGASLLASLESVVSYPAPASIACAILHAQPSVPHQVSPVHVWISEMNAKQHINSNTKASQLIYSSYAMQK